MRFMVFFFMRFLCIWYFVMQVFYLKDAIDCSAGMSFEGTVSMLRQDKNKRLYNLNLDFSIPQIEGSQQKVVYEIP